MLWTRLLLKILLFTPLVVLVMCINFFVDPSGIFRKGEAEDGIARLLLAGKHVAFNFDFDGRLVQKSYTAGLTGKKDVLVLGSSRSMLIRAELFPGKSFHNSSVSMATLNDQIAVYGMYRRRKLVPATILLCLDDSLLRGVTNQRWLSVREDYFAVARLMVHPSRADYLAADFDYYWSIWSQLFSTSYFNASIFRLTKGKKSIFFPTIEFLLDGFEIMYTDGSENFDRAIYYRSVEDARAIAGNIKTNEIRISTSVNERREFNAFISLLQTDGNAVIFYLPPFHPLTYKIISNHSKGLDEIQNHFVTIAKKRGIKLMGSYNPADVGCDETDFFDAGHLKEKGVKKIFICAGM